MKYKILPILLTTLILVSCNDEDVKEKEKVGTDKKQVAISTKDKIRPDPTNEKMDKSQPKENKNKELENPDKEKSDEKSEESTDIKSEEVIDDLVKTSSYLKSLGGKTSFEIKDSKKEHKQSLEGSGEFDPSTGEVLNGKYDI